MLEEAVHDDGYVEHANGNDVGYGAYLASRAHVSGAWDSRGDKVPPFVIDGQPLRAAWAYSEWMPIVSIADPKIGLSPLLQWIAVPSAAFAVMRWWVTKHSRR